MKRCICGYSSNLPFCDGQHQKEGWTCANSRKRIQAIGILSGENYSSLAEKLAHHLDANIIQAQSKKAFYQKLIILTDGTELDQCSLFLEQCEYQEVQLIAIGISEIPLLAQFPKVKASASISSDISLLWSELLLAISQKSTPNRSEKVQKIFISHSIKDEDFLAPIIKYLRKYLGVDVFLCSDSIPSGDAWYQKIITELEQTELVIAMYSQNFQSSQFCSFEMGVTRALQKKLLLIGIDDTTLPVFLQDIQAEFLSKNQKHKMWLSPEEALIDLILQRL
jgi:hypothetical protein